MIQTIDLALAILCNFPQMFVCAQFSTIGTAIHFIIKKVIYDLTAVLQSLYIYIMLIAALPLSSLLLYLPIR